MKRKETDGIQNPQDHPVPPVKGAITELQDLRQHPGAQMEAKTWERGENFLDLL